FVNPSGLAVDLSGNLLIVDSYYKAIRKVTPQGFISSVAGTSTGGIAIDPFGDLFVADCGISGSGTVSKVTPQGIISIVAGGGSGGDGGPATSAYVQCPRGVAIDGSGNLFFAEY